MEEVDEQHDARLITVVLDLVLEGIIEHHGLSFAPLPPLTSTAYVAALRDLQT